MVLLRCLVIAAAIGLVGCGDDGASGVDGGANGADAGNNPLIDASANGPDAMAGCANVPAANPSWITSYQDDIVARLTGQTTITPGVSLSDRATVGRRNTSRTYLLGKIAELGLSAQQHNYGNGSNPYAILPASSPSNSNIVIGAHFDTVPNSPGANDNATGVAMVLAIARYLMTVDCRQSNFYFVLFDQEEIGLVGSYEFAQWLDNQNINVTSVHTIDQMGWDQDNDRAIELERPDGSLYSQYNQSKAAAGLSMTLHQTGTGFTDHVSFRKFGFAAIGITEEFVNGDTTPHYHAPTDTYATVNFAYLQSTTVLANSHFARLARMSSAQMVRQRPRRDWPTGGKGHAAKAGCRHAYKR